MKNPYDIVLRPLVTEKGERDIAENNAYHFEVATTANKVEVKGAIEKIYQGVKVEKVRIISRKPKRRRFRFRVGYTSPWKKAIVYLRADHKIELF